MMTPRSGWTAGQVVLTAFLLLVIVIIALATLVGCGNASEPTPPSGPYEWRESGVVYVQQACTPRGDLLYYHSSMGSLAVVPAGCVTWPRS